MNVEDDKMLSYYVLRKIVYIDYVTALVLVLEFVS